MQVPPIINNVNNNVNKPSATDLNCGAQTTLQVSRLNVQSFSNKTNAVFELIGDKHLDVLVLTETWHQSSDDISLCLAAPAGFTAVDVVRISDPAHGGVVFLHQVSQVYHDCTATVDVVQGSMHKSFPLLVSHSFPVNSPTWFIATFKYVL